MQTTQGSTLQSLRNVKEFLDTNAATLDSVIKTGARQQLDEAIAELSAHASDQTGHDLASQGATRKHRSLRVALLRDHMAPISRIARADLPVSPETEPLKMPKARPSAERLAALAYGMAKAASPFANVFTSAGLPADFVVRLNAATDAMLRAMSDRSQSRGRRGGATTGLKTKLARGRRIVHVLDAFVKSALKDDAALLANWNIIKRVQRTPGRSTAAATPSTSATTESAGVATTQLPS